MKLIDYIIAVWQDSPQGGNELNVEMHDFILKGTTSVQHLKTITKKRGLIMQPLFVKVHSADIHTAEKFAPLAVRLKSFPEFNCSKYA